MPARGHVVLYVNGIRREVHGAACFLTVSDYLRYELGLTGTKVVCAEGDCGSCTVLEGRLEGRRLDYRPIDSCIRFVFQLDACHLLTIEGLTCNGQLTPIQQELVDRHGSQCGFCTPGFVMALASHGQRPSRGEPSGWAAALTGNLCRCTGYLPIFEAAEAAADRQPCIDHLYPPEPLVQSLAALVADSLELQTSEPGGSLRAWCPATLDEALALRARHPQAKVVAGATDLGVQWNKAPSAAVQWLDLNRLRELESIERLDSGGQPILRAGARASWTDLLDCCAELLPPFAEVLSVFGSPQIRHVGTLGGNLINASPIADSLPLLMVLEAELELANVAGSRRVNVNDFYRGYKQFDLRPDELLTAVRIPLPPHDDWLRLYKVSRRRDLDIATFTAGIRLRVVDGTIVRAALAYGAVAPTVLRLPQTETFLLGKPFDEQVLRAAGDVAVGEISPISDVRGSAAYRLQLARNVLLKFYHQQQMLNDFARS